MKETRYCQSCGMPLSEPSLVGTEADGAPSEDYCIYCYKDGRFTRDCTLEQMIESCAGFVDEYNRGTGSRLSREEYAARMRAWFPTLKRWKK